MASLVTLLIKVRSETPISFFFFASNVAFLILGLLLPEAPARADEGVLLGAFSPFGRRLIPYIRQIISDSANRLGYTSKIFLPL
jgi:hypothetical protein